jgi:hypothetical protein
MRCTLLTVFVALIACKDKRPEAPPPPPPPREGVTLIQPGEAPHQVLRYQLTKDTRTTSELVYDFDVRSTDLSEAGSAATGGPTNGSSAEPAGSITKADAGSDAHGDTKADRRTRADAKASDKRGARADSKAGAKAIGKAKAAELTSEHVGPAPTLVVTLETLVEDVLPDGTAKLRVTIVGTQVRDRSGSQVTSESLRAQASAADGVVFTEMLSPDGKISGARIETATALTPKARARVDELIQSLERVAMQLPSEPVGVGATWRERKPLPDGGIRAITETTYTLRSLSGTTAVYTGTGHSISGAQTIEQEGMKVEVTNPRGQIDTKGTIEFTRFAPTVMSTSVFAADMTVDAPKGTPGAGTSTVEVSVAVQMTPSPAEPPAAPAGAPSDGTPAPSTAAAGGSAASAPSTAASAPGSAASAPSTASSSAAHAP